MPGEQIKRDCFGKIIRTPITTEATDRFQVEYDAVLNKETGQFETKIVGKTDIVEITQSFKDQCGIEAMKLAIAKGQDPAIFADDGNHGGDFSGRPTNLNDAYRAALNSQQAAAQILGELGIDNIPDGADIDALISEAIKKKIEAASASTSTEDK